MLVCCLQVISNFDGVLGFLSCCVESPFPALRVQAWGLLNLIGAFAEPAPDGAGGGDDTHETSKHEQAVAALKAAAFKLADDPAAVVGPGVGAGVGAGAGASVGTDAVLDFMGDECVICLEPFEPTQSLTRIKRCGHGFHFHCIVAWVGNGSGAPEPLCPMCKGPVC